MTDETGEATPSGFVVLANGAAGSVDEESLAAAVAELAHHGPTVVRRTEGPDDLDDLRERTRAVIHARLLADAKAAESSEAAAG